MGSSLYLQGGAATQNTLKDTLTQVGHGFTVGSAIRYNAGSSQWVTARANNAENAEVVGVVSEVQTTDSFTVVYSGVINIPALAGVSYPALFLSDTVPGGITHNPPSVIGSVVKPVVVRSVSNDGGYVVVNYLGTQIGGSSTVAIDQIQPVGTIMPFAGTAIPDTWLECNAQPVGVTAYPELYDKVLHSALPRAPIYGHRVNLVGTGLVTANFAVGDIVQFKSTATAWSGGAYDSNATVLGKIISLTSSTNTTAASSMVVETLPIYNSTTKTFYHPNVVFGAGNGAATATAAATGYRVLTSAGGYRSGTPNIVVSTTSIIDFLTPNLQGKFPLGTNDAADADELTPSGSGFYNAASARTIGDLGGQEETLAGTQVATSTTTGLFATTVATGLREPNMPPFLTTKYIIKAKPYARAAIIDDVDVDYTRLLVTDLRSGIQRGAGLGEDLVFKTNTSLSTSGTERMRLTNDGKLGIGNTNPSYILTVKGGEPYGSFAVVEPSANATRIVLTVTSTGVSFGSTYFGTAVPIGFHIGNSEISRFDTSGRFGIGTTNPTGLLTVFQNTVENTAGGLTGSLSKCGLVLESTLNGSGDPKYGPGVFWKSTVNNNIPLAGMFVGGRASGTCINFATSTTYANGINKIAMTVTDGKVGIGKTGPSVALDVVGQINATSDITTSTTFIGNGTIPIGGIIMWSGAAVPAGWALCDGRTVGGQTTPDLRGRFIVGVNTTSITVPSGQAAPTVASTQPTYNRAAVGGLTYATIPEHTHDLLAYQTAPVNFFGSSQGPIKIPTNAFTENGVLKFRTQTNTSSTASTVENRPPYYALAFIMRVA